MCISDSSTRSTTQSGSDDDDIVSVVPIETGIIPGLSSVGKFPSSERKIVFSFFSNVIARSLNRTGSYV